MKNERGAEVELAFEVWLSRLRSFGFTVEIARRVARELVLPNLESQATLRVQRAGAHEILQLVYVPQMTLTRLLTLAAPLDDGSIVYATEHLSTRASDALRERRVHFIDAVGNAHISTANWLIDVRGRPSGQSASPAGPVSLVVDVPRNLFSTKRSQVIFALLSWPELLDAHIRTLARVAGVSTGLAHGTLAELRNAVSVDLRDAASRLHLQQAWLAAYPTGLARAHELGRYRGDVDRLTGELSVSGSVAAPELLKPRGAVVYVDELTPRLVAAHRWQRDPAGNVVVRRRFWRLPHENPAGLHRAPPLLVAADLLSSGDPREADAARKLLRARP